MKIVKNQKEHISHLRTAFLEAPNKDLTSYLINHAY